VCVCVCVFVCLSVCLCDSLSLYLSLSPCLPVCTCNWQHIPKSLYIYVYNIYIYICIYICIYIRDMHIIYAHITQPASVGGVESALMQQLQQRRGMPLLQLLHLCTPVAWCRECSHATAATEAWHAFVAAVASLHACCVVQRVLSCNCCNRGVACLCLLQLLHLCTRVAWCTECSDAL
jgi:hypothetical protein